MSCKGWCVPSPVVPFGPATHCRVTKINTNCYKVEKWKWSFKQIPKCTDSQNNYSISNAIITESFMVIYKKRFININQMEHHLECLCHRNQPYVWIESIYKNIAIACKTQAKIIRCHKYRRYFVSKDNNKACRHIIAVQNHDNLGHKMSHGLYKELQIKLIHNLHIYKPLPKEIIKLIITEKHMNKFFNNAVIIKLWVTKNTEKCNAHQHYFIVQEWVWSIIRYKSRYFPYKIIKGKACEVSWKHTTSTADSFICRKCQRPKNKKCKHVQYVQRYIKTGQRGIHKQVYDIMAENYSDLTNNNQAIPSGYDGNYQFSPCIDKWMWIWMRTKSNVNSWINQKEISQRHRIQQYKSDKIRRGIMIINKERNKYYICRHKILLQIRNTQRYKTLPQYRQFINNIQNTNNDSRKSYKLIKQLLQELIIYFKEHENIKAINLIQENQTQCIEIIGNMIKNRLQGNKKCQYCGSKQVKYKFVKCKSCGEIYCCRKHQKLHWNQVKNSHKQQCRKRRIFFQRWIRLT